MCFHNITEIMLKCFFTFGLPNPCMLLSLFIYDIYSQSISWYHIRLVINISLILRMSEWMKERTNGCHCTWKHTFSTSLQWCSDQGKEHECFGLCTCENLCVWFHSFYDNQWQRPGCHMTDVNITWCKAHTRDQMTCFILNW